MDLASGPGQVSLLKGLISGLFQDIFLALEIYIILGLIGLFGAKKHGPFRWVLFAVSSLLFSLLHIYLFIDIFLVLNLGIRVHNVFFYFFSDMAPFVDSAKELGLSQFLVLVILAVTVSAMVFYNYFKNFQAPRLNFVSAILAAGALVTAIFLSRIPSHKVKYYSTSPAFAHQCAFVNQLLPGKDADSSQFPKSDILSILPSNHIEEFSFVSEEFPLLKMTNRFKGPKNFHLKVDKNEKPHLIFLFLESFRAQDGGVLGSEKGVTPVFDKLAKEGVLFTDFYSTGVQTTRSVISSLFGIMPRYSEILGRDEILEKFPYAEKTTWGLHDEYLMRFITDWLTQKHNEGRPTFLTAFSVSVHHPYKVPSHYIPPQFNVVKESKYLPFFQDTARELYRRYLETMHYADYCIGLLVRLLKARGLYKKTIIFILADNAAPMGEHRGNYYALRFLYEENLKIPLLILAPGRLLRSAVVSQIGSQADLLPTVMDILGISGLNHAMGTSLVRRVQDRTIFFNNPFELGYRGLRKGSIKFIYSQQEKGIIAELYNLKTDPSETKNLLIDYDSVKRYHEEAQKVHSLFSILYHKRNFAPPN